MASGPPRLGLVVRRVYGGAPKSSVHELARDARFCAPQARLAGQGGPWEPGRGGTGTAVGTWRGLRPDRRGAGIGRDCWCGDREGEGAAGSGPGGDLGSAFDARRPAATALAAGVAERSAEPHHIKKAAYLVRARTAALDAARANGVGAARLRLEFPDATSFAPVRAKAIVVARIDIGDRQVHTETSAIAEAGAAAGSPAGSMPTMARGGGYSGTLKYRQGEGMRPDVAAAFDRMAAAARGRRARLNRQSGFRSDAEQAALFAAHPDPKWVALPGQSLHRCATELDLGPEAAYGWLAAKASRFGFVQRYQLGGVAFRLRRGAAALFCGGQFSRTAMVAGGAMGALRGCRPSRLRPGSASGRHCSVPPPIGTSPLPFSPPN